MTWLLIMAAALLELRLVAGYLQAAARWRREAREHRRLGGTAPRK